ADDLRAVDAEDSLHEIVHVVRTDCFDPGDAHLQIEAELHAIARQLEHSQANPLFSCVVAFPSYDDEITAADFNVEGGGRRGIDLQADVTSQPECLRLSDEVEVVSKAGGHIHCERATGLGDNPGARSKTIGRIHTQGELPASYGLLQN